MQREGLEVLAKTFRAEPYWWEGASPFRSAITLPERIDTLIVGSGFCGLSAGIRSLQLDASALVVDAGPIGGGASSRSGAMLSSGQKFLLNGASRRYSEQKVRDVSRVHAQAFDFVVRLAIEEGMDFDLQQSGRLFLASVPEHARQLAHHADILSTRAGVTAYRLDKSSLHEEIGSDRYFGGMVVEEFGGIHPSKFVRALADRFTRLGGSMASHTRVSRVTRDGAEFVVELETGAVRARHVLFATNGYTDRSIAYVKRRVAPAASYLIATEQIRPDMMAQIMPRRRMYSDSKHNLWYFRPSPDGTRVLFGARPAARDLRLEDAAVRLHGFLCEVFPQLHDVRISHCWNGNVAMTRSQLQQIGAIDGVFYAVGCNGSGAAIMPYLGGLAVERMLGYRREPTIFESASFLPFPPYGKTPWFIPLAVASYDFADWVERVRPPPDMFFS